MQRLDEHLRRTTEPDRVETVENASQAISNAQGTGCLGILGHPNRWHEQGLLAIICYTAASQSAEQCVLGAARSEELPTAIPTSSYLNEPPDADPHVRWCGRGGAVRPPPILITSLELSSG
jgi:hypothetical protein